MHIQELSPVHISRCWGFARHLMKLLYEERTALSSGLQELALLEWVCRCYRTNTPTEGLSFTPCRHLLSRVSSLCCGGDDAHVLPSLYVEDYCKWQVGLVVYVGGGRGDSCLTKHCVAGNFCRYNFSQMFELSFCDFCLANQLLLKSHQLLNITLQT